MDRGVAGRAIRDSCFRLKLFLRLYRRLILRLYAISICSYEFVGGKFVGVKYSNVERTSLDSLASTCYYTTYSTRAQILRYWQQVYILQCGTSSPYCESNGVSWSSITQDTSVLFHKLNMPNSRRYCFTVNNFTPQDVQRITTLGDHCRYLVFGRETGDSGTPHLQGFVIFHSGISFNSAKSKIGVNAHIEAARGSSQQAADYCKKDGDFNEFGVFPSQQGKRNDWDLYKEWVHDIGRVPSRHEIVTHWPSLYARYRKATIDYAEAISPSPVLTTSEPREGWQSSLCDELCAQPDDRTVNFVVDPTGNSGKTWFCKYMLTKEPLRVQIFRIGKRDDLSYMIDIDKDIFLFDIPRGQMTYLQYSVLECMKDRMIFSPKYESSFKILRSVPHVVVFCNEEPDYNAMSLDRYKVITI